MIFVGSDHCSYIKQVPTRYLALLLFNLESMMKFQFDLDWTT